MKIFIDDLFERYKETAISYIGGHRPVALLAQGRPSPADAKSTDETLGATESRRSRIGNSARVDGPDRLSACSVA